MIIDKPCLSVEEIKQRRFDLRTVANVSQEAEDISAVLEEDLIPGAIANELAEVGYCILYHKKHNGRDVVHIARPEEFSIENR